MASTYNEDSEKSQKTLWEKFKNHESSIAVTTGLIGIILGTISTITSIVAINKADKQFDINLEMAAKAEKRSDRLFTEQLIRSRPWIAIADDGLFQKERFEGDTYHYEYRIQMQNFGGRATPESYFASFILFACQDSVFSFSFGKDWSKNVVSLPPGKSIRAHVIGEPFIPKGQFIGGYFSFVFKSYDQALDKYWLDIEVFTIDASDFRLVGATDNDLRLFKDILDRHVRSGVVETDEQKEIVSAVVSWLSESN